MPVSFDNKLTSKIREAFDRYEEPFNELAWDLMRDKLSGKKKNRSILFINIAKAASVALIIGISVLIPHNLSDQQSDMIFLKESKDTNFENNAAYESEELTDMNSLKEVNSKHDYNFLINNKQNQYHQCLY